MAEGSQDLVERARRSLEMIGEGEWTPQDLLLERCADALADSPIGSTHREQMYRRRLKWCEQRRLRLEGALEQIASEIEDDLFGPGAAARDIASRALAGQEDTPSE